MTQKESEYITGVLYEHFLEIIHLVNIKLEKGESQKEIDSTLRYNFQTIINWAEDGFQKD